MIPSYDESLIITNDSLVTPIKFKLFYDLFIGYKIGANKPSLEPYLPAVEIKRCYNFFNDRSNRENSKQ